MFRIAWGELFMLLNPLWVPLFLFLTGRRRRRAWVNAAAQELGGTAQDARRVTGTTAGIPWELVLTYTLFPARPFWHLTFPSVTSTDLVLRAETSSDQKWKQRGFVAELTTGDEAFDARHLLLCSDPEAAARLLSHEPLRQAIAALPLEEDSGPATPGPKGYVPWVQAGQCVEAELDLHRVEEAEFPARLASFFQQLHTLVKTLKEAPRRGTPGPLRLRVLDTNAEMRITFTLALLSLPVGFTLLGALQVLTGNAAFPLGLLMSWLLGLAAGALAGLGLLGASRGQHTFHRRAWQVPFLAVIGSMLLPILLAGLNALPSGAPVEERQVKVLGASSDDMGALEFWELKLEGIGTVSLPYDFGKAIPRDSQVQVRVTTGRLGAPRVLGLTPVPAPAASPAVAGDSAP
jgi:hypothetical protein